MSLISIRRIPLYFKKLSLRVSLHDMTLLPFVMIFALVIFSTMSLSELEMPLLSYGTLAVVLASFLFMLTLVMREHKMSQYGFLHFMFLFILIAITVINVNDIRNAIYNSVSIWLMLLILRYYRGRMSMVLKCFAIAFAFAVYVNFIHILTHPMLWIIDDDKFATGYLLGNNYNQMGCRMIVALATNVLCLRYSRLWLINFIVMSVAIVASLAIVGSMTSLSMISLFLVYCLIPSARLRKLGIYSLFTVFVLFQVFVVFNGRGLENNELASYIVEDVLHKDLTFTNRTHMWESALKIISQSPVWGWGFADPDWYKSNMSAFAIGPHNFILSILIHGGVILLSLYLMICWKVFKAIKPYIADKTMQLLLFSVVCLWFMSLMEMYPYSIMFCALALLYYYPYYRQELAPAAKETDDD